MKPTRRHLLTGLSALAVAPLLAACGEDEATSGTTSLHPRPRARSR